MTLCVPFVVFVFPSENWTRVLILALIRGVAQLTDPVELCVPFSLVFRFLLDKVGANFLDGIPWRWHGNTSMKALLFKGLCAALLVPLFYGRVHFCRP